MKFFEIAYLISEPFLPALYEQVRLRLWQLSGKPGSQLNVLDVGGRKSHYTIGFPFAVTISDLPRESDIQKNLHLGINDEIKQQVLSRRSNIKEIVYDDMSCSNLPSNSFDGIIAVEVLEHVEKDDGFLHHVHRVLKPGGFFLMTTPNGDHVVNTNPDHKRHYKKHQLEELVRQAFGEVEEISYMVADTKQLGVGLASWSLRNPIRTLESMSANLVSRRQSRNKDLLNSKDGTLHLVVVARKR